MEIAHKTKSSVVSISPDFPGDIIIVITAFNEEDNLAHVTRKIPKSLLGLKVSPLIIDDGSADKTFDIIKKENLSCVKHVKNFGQGFAIQTGFSYSLKYNPKVIVTLDADGQHDVKDLENIIKPILDDECDLTVGSRYMGNQHYVNRQRHIGIYFFTKVLNFFCRTKISDCTNGFRAFNPELLKKIKLTENRFNALEILIETAWKGFRIKNVPVSVHSRLSGETKKPKRLGYPLGISAVIFKTWVRNFLRL